MILREHLRLQPVGNISVGTMNSGVEKPDGLYSIEIFRDFLHEVRGAVGRRNDFDYQTEDRGQRCMAAINTLQAFTGDKRHVRPAYGGLTQLHIGVTNTRSFIGWAVCRRETDFQPA